MDSASKAGPTASEISASSGESRNMTTIEVKKSSALPISIGSMLSRLWTMFRSEMDRLTIWPVCSWSCRAPSSLVSEPNSSVRRSCCTSRDNCPPRYRRRYTQPKLTSAATMSNVAPGQMACRWVRMALSMMSRWISGMAVVTRVARTDAPNATRVRLLCRQQYAASRRSQPSP